ncbi:hypothetical protein JM946_19005 [Steroidobacter sp. S1-65]|uniref:Uncharacterized protein n=1 Tax=Steroidobacter gossypii TaxID=2805490 RepID=A0ABS1X0U0_9GAMM|nr:secretin N-terminal domain-containing protein [Steroidobacter gossypii]MBM0106828.1 hypothetical protein [Steroidobacter gossypii]
MTRMFPGTLAALVLAFTPLEANAQSDSADPNTVPIATVLAAVAKSSGKKFFVDPRVTGDVLLLQAKPDTLSYDDLLMLLQVHGFTAVTTGDYVRVIPDAGVRHMALPVADSDNFRPAEYVTKVIAVKHIPAAMLVPTLRPLLPQQAHLVALPCVNRLIVADTFGNVQRIEQVIQSLDRGEPYTPPQCSTTEPAPAPARSAKSGKE